MSASEDTGTLALHLTCVNSGGLKSLVLLDKPAELESAVPLSEDALQSLKIWRARSGEVMTVVDSEGTCYRARLQGLASELPMCIPFERLTVSRESSLRLVVFQSLPERERFEFILQKLTELGVSRMVPMETAHSTTVEERDAGQKKSHRWPDVILRAARQSRRALLPELMSMHTFQQSLSAASELELKLLLNTPATSWKFVEVLGSAKPQSVAIMVGPEGGFSADEIEQASAAGFLPVSLGPRVLRTETAAIVAAALAQSYLGDLR